MTVKVGSAVRVFRYLPSVVILHDSSVILFASLRIGEIFYIIANRDNDLICDKSLVHQVQNEKVSHLAENELGFLGSVGLVQNLTGAETVCAWPICFDCFNGARLPTPRMVNQQLRIFAEELVLLSSACSA